MKTKILSKLLLILGLVFVLGSAITQVRGGVVTIGSGGDVIRGETGFFYVHASGLFNWNATSIYFSVSGTAISGIDYVPLVSPVGVVIGCRPCGPTTCCYGDAAIRVETLPDPSFSLQAYSVVVTLEPGAYTIGEPSSATIWIYPPGAPGASTNPAAKIASFSATLHGTVNPNGFTTSVQFQYGTTTSYGSTTSNQSYSGNTTRAVSANISGLAANTTYHFRIVATNSHGTRYGSDRTFTT